MKKLIITLTVLALLAGGLIAFWFMTDEGPSRWNACKTAEAYLVEKYGKQNGSWFITDEKHELNEENPLQGAYTLKYTWNGEKGYLLAYYDDYKSNPSFTIREPRPNQP